MTYATTGTQTYTALDIEAVFRSFKADLRMVAASTSALTLAKAEEYGYDAEYLAKNGYLASVDVTLMDEDGEEVRAACYTVNTTAGDLTSNRPGGVLWPKTPDGDVRIILYYTAAWSALTSNGRAYVSSVLKNNWGPTSADTSHTSLKAGGERAFVSSVYGVERKDFSK
jgi:hypothetical protein